MTYPWGDTRRFNSYAGYFRRLFGCRVQKLSVDAASPAPTATGRSEREGVRSVTTERSPLLIACPRRASGQQIAEGIEFHRNRYRSAQRYLVYFQAFSNTYAPLERLKRLYDEALAHPGVAGIVVGTRPTASTSASSITSPGWPGIGMSPSNTASNRPSTPRSGPSTGATTSRAPAAPSR